ncbi:MAG: hypothetical protein AAF591_18415 [Verrucomicrobiota bacterium]
MIHPTAIVETSAPVPDDVEIGPYACIEGNVTIGAGCRIGPRTRIVNRVTLGDNCAVGAGTIIGSAPEFPHHQSDPRGEVKIGSNTVLRELVVINRSLEQDSKTTLGDDNYLMAGTHIGAGSKLGNQNVIANDCRIGAGATIENNTFLGGGCALRPALRIGSGVMMRGHNAMSKDVPPFLTAYGDDLILGLNAVGMRRLGLGPSARREIKHAFTKLYQSGQTLEQCLAETHDHSWDHQETAAFWHFVSNPSPNGLCLTLTKEG